MKYSNTQVEQVDLFGNIIIDNGEILSPAELKNILLEKFDCSVERDGFVYGTHENNKYCFCFKNISYLGIPHPNFKKRIQIPKSFVEAYNKNLMNGIPTFFIGIYKYKENIVFVNFNTEKYVKNKANNSSAHVLTIDLVYAAKNGYYLKKDSRDNEIFCFNESAISSFFDMYLLKTIDYTPEIFKIFNQFYDEIDLVWDGLTCYKEMIDVDYHRKFQSEWAGAYIEFLFEKFLKKHPKINSIVTYSPQRGLGNIDLDIYFPSFEEYGDLKSHSNNVSPIIGNKTETIKKCIENKKSVYYIVFNHDTELDKNFKNVVTKFWNQSQNKEDLMSYAGRMKNNVKLTDYMILEINENNFKYLKTDFQKNFKNSDGKKRSEKISISKRMIPYFLIHKYSNKPY